MRKLQFNLNRKILYMILCLVLIFVFSLTLVYAALSTTLNIIGIAQINNASWDIHLENVVVNPYSVSIDPKIIDNDKITFTADLTTPGEFYKFTVDIVNSGSIDAMVESIIKSPELTTDQKKYLKYEVEYVGGASINETQLIKSGEKKTISVFVSYRNDIPISDLPTNEINLNLEIRLVYVQANSLGTEVLDNSSKYNITYVGFDDTDYLIQTEENNNLVIKFHNVFNEIKIKSGDNYLSEDDYLFDGDNLTIYNPSSDLTIINLDYIQIIPDFTFSNEAYVMTMGGYNVYRVNATVASHNRLSLNETYDISNMKYVEFDFYIPDGYDPKLLKGIQHQFELSSSGKPDVDELGNSGFHYWYDKLVAGQWNHVVFSLSDCTGWADKTKINYIGIYWSASDSNNYSIPGCIIKNFKFSNYIL